ncbi:MAG: zf-HC2 domain-containing protein [Phycisphaerales bacterium]|nr:zf-HC2 domain-containing protein [Phycisphaerales bacterium]
MNAEEFEAMLAEYLGDELAPDERRAFEAHLAEHPEHQAEVDELSGTLDELARLQAAPDREPTLLKANARTNARRGSTRLFASLAKAAAILIFGVIIGRWTASEHAPAPSHNTPQETTYAEAPSIHPGWIELANRLGTNSASFAGLLSAGASTLH